MPSLEQKPYYMAYEDRYRKVYEAGAERWGYSPDSKELIGVLTAWVEKHGLKGRRVVEFACGEGASGVILSELGCVYHGMDIAPTAVAKARSTLHNYPHATVSLLDMARQKPEGAYDAALDVMGLHMLVTDSDREAYLKNAFACLASGAPMLFFHESCREDAYEGEVVSIDQWIALYSLDLTTPEKRVAKSKGKDVEVCIPLLAARPRSRGGYAEEMAKAGFMLDSFGVMESDEHISHSATLHVHKP